MKKITGLNFLGNPKMPIPARIPQKAYLLEYLPGTYGDYIAGIISYSIDEFYDHHGDVGLPWEERYWVANGATIARNRYPLSLRGAGYEHVEHYTDLMLSHHVHLMFPDIFESEKTKAIFNCHPRLRDQAFRTLEINTNLLDAETKFLYIDPTFDNIFQCSVNEYFTGIDHITDRKNNNKQELFFGFLNKLKIHDRAKEEIPDNQLLKIGNLRDLSPEHIECYGEVNAEKFEEYKDYYCKQKLDMLEWNTSRLYEKMKMLEPERLEFFKYAYDHREIKPHN